MIRMRNNFEGNNTERCVENMDRDRESKQIQVKEVLHSFNQVKHSLLYLLRKNADAMGTTFMQSHVLQILREHPDIGLTELSELILVGNSTTSGLVDRLVKSELVSRKRLESDRRSVTLRITDKGVELQDRMERANMQSLSPLNQLSVNDRQDLLRIHQQMNEILQQQGRDIINYE
ncbi:DNA-binding MarR family transcriptional regulator [Paenibacillus sp. DS2015]|uniref:MarR family winged helix-turn-helix transcriptional regulator n=1 Tax=Paenibacillus sp. DS2015 TaxID=3373917 RepID=UPI003D20CEEF